MNQLKSIITVALIAATLVPACREQQKPLLTKEINSINLKTGNVVLCGPDDKGVGKVSFIISGDDSTINQFNFGIALLP
ncbi:hypothetical protein A4D02_33765 [Niastella koreensis]|uniref:Uncharacterized protein n=2 Tax=Niastella koreensis TaxID=354356 RepID=G8TAK0_NIAKG|nr:hypothetical protein [Niastella koreensis]AEV98162.1 hypothetical protein Niako_1799 [Niastella koreensis GR20-10]OQP45367.1 hypothetical protein A4D02_33765 [Niastella koreensis]